MDNYSGFFFCIFVRPKVTWNYQSLSSSGSKVSHSIKINTNHRMRPIGLFPVCRHRIDVVYITHTIRLKLPKEASQRHKQTHVHAAFINSGLSLVNKSLYAVFSRAPPGSLLRLFFFLFCRCRRFAFVGGSRLVLSITFVPFTWSRFESVVNHVLPQKKYI